MSVLDCFRLALLDEKNGRKHKGLLVVKPDDNMAQAYIAKARKNLELCDVYREGGYDYKIPEEWYYTLYYCALAILAKFGVESRSQKCTAAFLRHVKDAGLIDYDAEFIDRITVYRDKDTTTDVDEREKARYGASTRSEEIGAKYERMTALCKQAIAQAESIVYTDKTLEIPRELTDTKLR
jgi:uncharacterized protein (UPF0332 family)